MYIYIQLSNTQRTPIFDFQNISHVLGKNYEEYSLRKKEDLKSLVW